MSEKLEQAKADYIAKLKLAKLAEAGIAVDELERYSKFIDAEEEQEIEQKAQAVAADIKQEDSFGDVYQDERSWRPFK